MTSPRRRRNRPVRSVALRITFEADGETSAKVKEAVPTARFRRGVCEVRVEGERPADVAERARVILEKLREI